VRSLRPLLASLLLAGSSHVQPALAEGIAPIPVPARLVALAAADSAPPAPRGPRVDTLRFRPSIHFFDSTGHEPALEEHPPEGSALESTWLRAPMGDQLLDHPDPWNAEHPARTHKSDVTCDYNRVDLLRFGLHTQVQRPMTMYPRLGARYEIATGRKRSLYGIQLEQPLFPTARFVFGFGLVRRTDHGDLEQVDDAENSLAMLFARNDHRDYFEREGAGAYLSWRVPDFSTVSLHVRGDEYRSLGLNRSVRSWLHQSRALRENPAIDDGRTRSVVVRLERLTRRSAATRAGLYHWAELERAGGELGGDFDYLRLLADVRSVFRLSPATTLSLRGVAGTSTDGALPLQKRFRLGGLNGLRAHPFHAHAGNQVALAQAEYTVGLWALRGEGFEGGLHAIAFADLGRAWWNGANRWDVERQQFATDVGFGLATGEDGARVYMARNLNDRDARFVWSLRLQRPF
jgi:hypothetical protein